MTTADPAIVDRSPPKGAAVDPLFKYACAAAATMVLITMGGLIISLAIGGWPAFHKFGLGLIFNKEWNPAVGQETYGGAGPIVDTLISAFAAVFFAVPIAFGVAVFLVEFCPQVVARPIGIAVELLAGIPSIVYGIWGLFVFAPLFAKYIQLPLMTWAPAGSIWEKLFAGVPNGANILTASIIVAIMILPYMAAVLRDLLLTVPPQLRESGYGMGSTSLEVVTSISIPFVRRSAIGAIMLGLGRALGETMAVTFIIGNSPDFPTSIFSSGSTIASTIANEFSEASDLQSSALIGLGLVLFVITFAVLAIARLLLGSEKGA
jgi:phosphate transport system permease protein